MEVKRCSGYKGHWECENDYPSHMVPVDEFGKGANLCGRCKTRYDSIRNPTRERHPITGQFKMDWKTSRAIGLGGDIKNRHTPEWKSFLNKAEEQWGKGITEWKINDKVVSRTFRFDDKITYSTQKEQTKRNRDSKVVSYIRSVYDSCSVVGCDYLDYDVAHIHALKHGADDLPENCLALCPNHHRDLDRGRMIDLQQLDGGGYIYFGDEDDRQGIDLKHKVDSKYLDRCNLELEEWKNGTNKVYSENDRPSLAVGK